MSLSSLPYGTQATWKEGTRQCSQPRVGSAWRSPHPELAQGVDVLGLEEGVVVAVHQALPVDHGSVVHQDGDVAHLQGTRAAGSIRAAPGACALQGWDPAM